VIPVLILPLLRTVPAKVETLMERPVKPAETVPELLMPPKKLVIPARSTPT
jgi:hypothetical protein